MGFWKISLKRAFVLEAKQLFCEAEEWFLDETSDSLFSFENICEVLRIKPNYFRKGLLRWKEAHRTPLIERRHKLAQQSVSSTLSQYRLNQISRRFRLSPASGAGRLYDQSTLLPRQVQSFLPLWSSGKAPGYLLK
jgi:hypothetical protein